MSRRLTGGGFEWAPLRDAGGWRLLIACLLLTLASAQIDGSDISEPVSAAQAQMLRRSGQQYAIVRCLRSTGTIDPACASSVRNLQAAGIQVGQYAFLNVNRGTGAQEVRRLADFNRQNNLNGGRIWLDIEQPAPGTYWSRNQAVNQRFYNDAVAEARRQGVPLGVYTDRTMWNSIMGSRFSGSAPDVPLWYSHYPSPETAASRDRFKTYNDFRPFGGWQTPALKQIGEHGRICQRGVPCVNFDVDWEGPVRTNSMNPFSGAPPGTSVAPPSPSLRNPSGNALPPAAPTAAPGMWGRLRGWWDRTPTQQQQPPPQASPSGPVTAPPGFLRRAAGGLRNLWGGQSPSPSPSTPSSASSPSSPTAPGFFRRAVNDARSLWSRPRVTAPPPDGSAAAPSTGLLDRATNVWTSSTAALQERASLARQWFRSRVSSPPAIAAPSPSTAAQWTTASPRATARQAIPVSRRPTSMTQRPSTTRRPTTRRPTTRRPTTRRSTTRRPRMTPQ